MIEPRFGDLEVLTRFPAAEPRPAPVLFIHGAYTGAWCWEPYFLPYFAEAGYASYAVSLRGHGRSKGRSILDSTGIADYVADIASVVSRLPAEPVLVGHSMGGMVVQKYLEQANARAVVLMASVPPQGLWASAVGLAFKKPGLLGDLNRLLGGGKVPLDTLREALFFEPVPLERLKHYYEGMQAESHRAIWDMTLFNLPHIASMHRPPMLVLGAEHDHLVPASMVEMTGRSYGVEAEVFAGMGHGMMLERSWRKVAGRIGRWLAAEGI